MTDAAALETERVAAEQYTLRPWEPGDLPWVQEACQDPEIHRWTRVPRPYRAGDALAFLSASRQGRADASAYEFAIVRTDSDELVGAIDVRDLDTTAPGRIGYWVAWEARRQGIAACALGAIARWSVERLGVAHPWLVAAETNRASCRVAERAGFRLERLEPDGAADGDQRVPGAVYVRP